MCAIGTLRQDSRTISLFGLLSRSILATVDRFTWGVSVGAVALIVAALAAVLLLQRAPAPVDLTTPEGVVRAYVQALDTSQPEDAWNLLGQRQQAEISRDEFVRRATTAYRSPHNGRIAIESTTVEAMTARVEMSRTYSGGGGPFGIFGSSSYNNRFTARLEQQSGRWRITVPPEDYLIGRLSEPVAPAVVVTATPPPAPLSTATPAPSR